MSRGMYERRVSEARKRAARVFWEAEDRLGYEAARNDGDVLLAELEVQHALEALSEVTLPRR